MAKRQTTTSADEPYSIFTEKNSRLPEDTVFYAIFPDFAIPSKSPSPNSTPAQLTSALQSLHLQIVEAVSPYTLDYIWQHEPFTLTVSSTPSCVCSSHVPHLHGKVRFGDNLEDEWFVVYLLFEVSRRFRNVCVRVWDTDGEFLLIEAAFHLPRWIDPENSENRVFVRSGELCIVPRDKLLNPSLIDALIDELKVLWNEGIRAYDRQTASEFTLKAAVLWTISDFPGLGMLGGKKTKGYKACPECLDETDCKIHYKRAAYQGHRRWLPRDHNWRKDEKSFNGEVEFRDPPPSLSGSEILAKINFHEYPILSLHPKFDNDQTKGLCWTYKSIFYELPYWETLRQPHSLDVMHIEKNVFDNIIGTILNIEGKTRDDLSARKGLQRMKIRRSLWPKYNSGSSVKPTLPHAPYTVLPEQKVDILEMIQDIKYPHGYAGSLKSKINLKDKTFSGLKSHDCHVLLQRILPIVIRPYLPLHVVSPLILLSRWFQKLCCRELKREDILHMKAEIVTLLCKLERIFPPAFFTIMVHLMIHLPDQLLLKGPVHYSWMYPFERQLGEYKKYIRNTRYPEGCIAEQYISRECATFCKLYMEVDSYNNTSPDAPSKSSLSVASDLIIPHSYSSTRLSKKEIYDAHWCVLENCKEAQYFIDYHKRKVEEDYPNIGTDERIKSFITYFRIWMNSLKRKNDKPREKSGHKVFTQDIVHELHKLANEPQSYNCYSMCYVNGVKFVTWERDEKLTTQNSGVMVEAGDKYYGVLKNVIELIYADGLKVIVFKCRWFDTGHMRNDSGLLLIDTSKHWYEDAPYCLAATTKQVFYIDDPNQEGEKIWKVVNEVAHRGTYTAESIARNEFYEVDEDAPYQEATPMNIPGIYITPADATLGQV